MEYNDFPTVLMVHGVFYAQQDPFFKKNNFK